MTRLLDQEREARGGIHLVGCTVTGPSHERDGVPCQDAWHGTRLDDGRFVLAVADGLGSAPQSDRGSRLATRAATDALTEHLLDGGSIDEGGMEDAMEGAFAAARTRIEEAAAAADAGMDDFHTTLLAVAAGPAGAAAGAVGDGGLVGHRDGEHFLLVPKEETEYSNVTTPVTGTRWETEYRFRYHEAVEAAAVFTDGISPFVWDLDDPDRPRPEFFDQIFELARSATDHAAATRTLCSFLSSEHFRSYSGDDKTLAVGRVAPLGVGDRLLFGRRRARELLAELPERAVDERTAFHDRRE